MSPRPPISADEQEAALHPILWFLDHLGYDGLPLTSAGYLKPEDVLAAVLPTMTDWIGTNNREHHTIPVLYFREALQHLGLLRKYKGRLKLTKIGASARGDATSLWSHLAERGGRGKTDSMDV